MNKGLFSNFHSAFELRVLRIPSRLWSIPGGVVNSNSRAKIGGYRISGLICNIDPIIYSIYFQNQRFINLLINIVKILLLEVLSIKLFSHGLYDLLTIVLIDQPSTRHFSNGLPFSIFSKFFFFLFLPPVTCKSFLMVIESSFFDIEDTTDVALNI